MTTAPAISVPRRSRLAGANAPVRPCSFHARVPPNQSLSQAPWTGAENQTPAPRWLSQRQQPLDAPGPAAFTPWTRPQVR